MRQSAKRAGGPSKSQLKKKKKNDTDDNETEQCSAEVLEQMEWLKYHPPTRENLSQIKANLKATFFYRRSKLVKEAPSITNQLAEMPRFRDSPDLINFEFDMLNPGCGSKMLVKWNPYFRPKLTQLSEEAARFNDLDVFKFLLKKLPTVTAKGFKSKGYDVFSFIMQRRQTGTDVEAFAKTKDVIYAQPFILALGDENGNPTEYFIIVDNTSIPGGTNAVEAFDRLYKVHYVFNVHFAKPVLTFFNFFDGLVYGVSKNIRPLVRSSTPR
ncbi:uncharacterized protein [Amphiura filiformis]|uniref:uncharacterized protein n=1 Tax=Amphiura filiformis TaxID=82378 RepID=UPI003B21D999